MVGMTSVTLGHPAPWPILDLDVAAVRAGGCRPAPFRQFILKVHSRCNLACSYCYVYELEDQAWRHLPMSMDSSTAAKVVERIAEHAARHKLDSVDVIVHGGEPLLAGEAWLANLVASLRARVPAQVNVAVQTNGTLLSRPMLEALSRLDVSIGVSLDGDSEATGRNRSYRNGRNSFDAVARGLLLLGSPEFRDCYSGILCVIDTRNDPIATYEALLKFSPPALDLLLPHANWSSPPPGGGYADWLISVFDRWYSAPRQETQIRLFRELIQLIFGQPGAVEGLGITQSTVAVVDTDGSIKQLDSLSSAYPGAADTGLDVLSNSFDDALDHPTTVARQMGAAALSPDCLDCPVLEICGGGLYPHRYRAGVGFRNRSVYCDDLLKLITHVRDRVVADLGRLNTLWSIQLTSDSISAVILFPCAACRASGCSMVSVASYLLRTSSSRRLATALFPAVISSMDRLAAAMSVSGWVSPSESRHLSSVASPIWSASPRLPQAARSAA